MRPIARLLFGLLIAATTAAAAQERTAVELAALKAQAEAGAAAAQLDYAKALADKAAARVWAQKAADQGLAEAWFWIGYALTSDDSVPYYAKAAELGYDRAFGYLLDDLLFRAGDKVDIAQAKKFGDLARARSVSVGYDTPKMLDTIDRCFEAGAPTIPVADLPTAAERKQAELDKCDPPYLTPPATPAAYRRYKNCLLSERPPENRWLGELYANGWGVRRNPKLAIALFCHGSEVPAELEGLVDALASTRDEPKLREPFLFCRHITSGVNQAVCAARGAGPADAARDRRWTQLTLRWTVPQRAAFGRARAAASAFFEARAYNEVSTEGTGRIAYAIDAEAQQQDDWLNVIRQFEAGKLPPRLTLADVDVALNDAYGTFMRRESREFESVRKDAVRDTQRQWIAYRDAWAAFAARRYPSRTADDWKAWATAARTAQLQDLLADR